MNRQIYPRTVLSVIY